MIPSPPFFSLYIHVPFCRRLCDYCHFYRTAPPGDLDALAERYREALLREARAWRDTPWCNAPVRTIYFGGGDPSLFPGSFFRGVLEGLGEVFDLSGLVEVSAEAGGDTDPARLGEMVAAGVGRISLGAVSFDPDSLSLLGRRQDPGRTREAVEALRQGGCSVGLDLVYAYAGQTAESWRRDLETALLLDPDHLSTYALSAHPERGPREGDPDQMAFLFREARRAFLAGGYRHYEIGNFALPGAECRHNLNYWADGDYLGLGPGAHSSLTRVGTTGDLRTRFANREDAEAYLADPGGVRETLAEERGEERAGEALMLALRTGEGVDLAAFRARYRVDPARRWRGVWREFSALGLVRVSPSRIRLTTRGMLLSNELFARLV